MKYRVIITPEAQLNISEAYDYIAARSPMNANKWVRELYAYIDSLEIMPRRFGVAHEQPRFAEEIRQLGHKSYRVIFTIKDEERVVKVISVRHAKRRGLREPPGQIDD